MFVHCCHCTECQRFSGSAFAINATIEMDRLALLAGSSRRYTLPTDPDRSQGTLRCADCGVALWSHHPYLGDAIALVFTGTLDTPQAFAPAAHCFVRSKQAWVTIPDGVPAADEHYDFETTWPKASLERLATILGGG